MKTRRGIGTSGYSMTALLAAGIFLDGPACSAQAQPCCEQEAGYCHTQSQPAPEGIWQNPWPGGVVPFEFDTNPSSPGYVSPANQQKTLAAMATIEAVCSADFVPRNGEPDYVQFRNGTTNSSERIGKKAEGGMQFISMLTWDAHYCIVHEMIHALGGWHENQRPDRDVYITTNMANVEPGTENNFVIKFVNYAQFPWYDFDSVMHYRRFHFTGNGYPTIDMKPGYERWRYRIGQITHLSTGDIWLLRVLYNGGARALQPPGVFDLVTPPDGAAVGAAWSPGFSWSAALQPLQPAAHQTITYRLLVDDDRYFGSPEMDTTLAGTSFAGGSLENGRVYYWTVTAENNTGSTRPWHTPVAHFYTGSSIPGVLHVDDSAPAGGDGASWATAFRDLQDALALAECAGGVPVEVRIGQGVYEPDRGSGDRVASFVLRSNLTLRGGYAGYGAPNPDERNIASYASTLSGDLASDDRPGFENYSDNSIHVLWAAGARSGPTTLDGLIVASGNADGAFPPTGSGGGLWADDCEVRLQDCVFTACRGTSGGAAALLQACDATIERCDFVGNSADPASSVLPRGGGLHADNGWRPIAIDRCTFVDNESARAGGLFLGYCVATVTDTLVENNSAGISGGGALNFGGDITFSRCRIEGNTAVGPYGGAMNVRAGADVALVNCLLTGNTAATGGGAIEAEFNGAVSLVNCTLAGNDAPNGGGIYVINQPSGSASATVSNSIIYGNAGTQILTAAGATAIVTYSCIEGGWSGLGVGNTATNPLFINPAGGNYTIGPNSPCIDSASNNLVPAGVTTDLAGSPRFIDDQCTIDTGVGSGAIVDMGAYEYRFYPDCNLTGSLTIADFACFQSKFAAQDPYADCNQSGTFTIADFGCFQSQFAAGCP